MKSPGLTNEGAVGVRGGTEIFSLETCRNGNAVISEGHLGGGSDLREIREPEGLTGNPGGELQAGGIVGWNSGKVQG